MVALEFCCCADSDWDCGSAGCDVSDEATDDLALRSSEVVALFCVRPSGEEAEGEGSDVGGGF